MERVARGVERELGRFGPAGTIAAVVEAWPAAVGPAVARNAWPARIGREGTLYVSTSSAAWAFELGQLAPDVLGRLRESLGEAAPSGLRFAVGPLPEPSGDKAAPAARARPSPGPAERELAAALTAGLADEELRELVARAAAASLARAAASRGF